MADAQGRLKVLLCHASENKPIVKDLYNRLASAGYEPLLDSDAVLPGMNWDSAILQAIRESDVVIVCLSSISMTKEGRFQKEFKYVREVQKEKSDDAIFLIPLRLDSSQPPSSLADLDWADDTAADGFERLVNALNVRARQVGKVAGKYASTPARKAKEDTHSQSREIKPRNVDLSDGKYVPLANAQPTQGSLSRIWTILEKIRKEIPPGRFFEFGDDQQIVKRIQSHLEALYRLMNDIEPTYTSKPSLAQRNLYFNVVRAADNLDSFVGQVRSQETGWLQNTTRLNELLDQLEDALSILATLETPSAPNAADAKPEQPKANSTPVSRPTPSERSTIYEPAVFISYAWGGKSEEIVKQIETSLQQRGLTVIRDRRAMAYKDSIREFMERLAKGDCVILIISDKYLRSPNCMFELVEIAGNKQFHVRVFPVILSDADIYDAIKQVQYIKYWEQKLAELNRELDGVNRLHLTGIYKKLDLYDRIRDNISHLVDILSDMNTLTPEMHEGSDFSELYNAIEERIKGRQGKNS